MTVDLLEGVMKQMEERLKALGLICRNQWANSVCPRITRVCVSAEMAALMPRA